MISRNCSLVSPRTASAARSAVKGVPPTNSIASTIRRNGGGAPLTELSVPCRTSVMRDLHSLGYPGSQTLFGNPSSRNSVSLLPLSCQRDRDETAFRAQRCQTEFGNEEPKRGTKITFVRAATPI